MNGDAERLAEALWDALDERHDRAYHVHAAECCWPFGGTREVLADRLAAHDAALVARAQAGALREAAEVADRGTITGIETTRPDLVARWLRARADREHGAERGEG